MFRWREDVLGPLPFNGVIFHAPLTNSARPLQKGIVMCSLLTKNIYIFCNSCTVQRQAVPFTPSITLSMTPRLKNPLHHLFFGDLVEQNIVSGSSKLYTRRPEVSRTKQTCLETAPQLTSRRLILPPQPTGDVFSLPFFFFVDVTCTLSHTFSQFPRL